MSVGWEWAKCRWPCRRKRTAVGRQSLQVSTDRRCLSWSLLARVFRDFPHFYRSVVLRRRHWSLIYDVGQYAMVCSISIWRVIVPNSRVVVHRWWCCCHYHVIVSAIYEWRWRAWLGACWPPYIVLKYVLSYKFVGTIYRFSAVHQYSAAVERLVLAYIFHRYRWQQWACIYRGRFDVSRNLHN